jgi:hypothetical protein
VAPAARFLVKIVRTALRAVATDGEENVNATRDQVIPPRRRYLQGRARS